VKPPRPFTPAVAAGEVIAPGERGSPTVNLNRLARGVLHPPKPHLVPLEELPRILTDPLPGSVVARTAMVPE